jgi:hypothetical protein
MDSVLVLAISEAIGVETGSMVILEAAALMIGMMAEDRVRTMIVRGHRRFRRSRGSWTCGSYGNEAKLEGTWSRCMRAIGCGSKEDRTGIRGTTRTMMSRDRRGRIRARGPGLGLVDAEEDVDEVAWLRMEELEAVERVEVIAEAGAVEEGPMGVEVETPIAAVIVETSEAEVDQEAVEAVEEDTEARRVLSEQCRGPVEGEFLVFFSGSTHDIDGAVKSR